MVELSAGVDIGSTTTKAVLIDADQKVIAFSIIDTTYDRNKSGQEVLERALKKIDGTVADLAAIFSTGYGRRSFELSEKAIPEIICHARGTVHLLPGVKTIIDVGGQDFKIIELNSDGSIAKFDMNDKCAAGTGRFFEVLSKRLLNVQMEDLGPLALSSRNPCLLSSTCTVFAESEIVSYLSQGIPQSDIAMGMLISVAKRVWAMGKQAGIAFEEPIVVSGGIARNVAAKRAFEERFGKSVYLIENPQMQAALGAALIACDSLFADRSVPEESYEAIGE
jgi:(R)-2-hydroxyacyl-CoA dehydratese activating ATPase